MATRDDTDSYQAYGYGTKYLTPVQRTREESLAPDRFLEASMRAREAAAAVPNPLVETGPQLATSVVPPVPAPAPNPLVQPPVPLSTMGTDQQIAWQQLEDATRAQRAQTAAQLLATEANRRKMEFEAEQSEQGTAMLAELSNLAPHDLEKYPLQKAELLRKYPKGAGSVEANRILDDYEKLYAKHLSVDEESKKAETTRRETAKQKRLDAGYKEAEKQGADVLREYAARVEKDPEDANRFLGEVQQRNMISILRNAGMGDQEIAQKYGGGETGRPFDYQAAGQAPKGRAAVLQERNKATSEWLALDKERRSAGFGVGFDPSHPEATPEWTPAHEQAYQNKLEAMNSLTPQIGDNRGGVVGMGAREGESIYKGYQQVPVAQQPAVVTARPAAKPPPPPLNPKYPEQWVRGKRYIQMPDGKLYLSKVQ